MQSTLTKGLAQAEAISGREKQNGTGVLCGQDDGHTLSQGVSTLEGSSWIREPRVSVSRLVLLQKRKIGDMSVGSIFLLLQVFFFLFQSGNKLPRWYSQLG